jgi:hypothetical protein
MFLDRSQAKESRGKILVSRSISVIVGNRCFPAFLGKIFVISRNITILSLVTMTPLLVSGYWEEFFLYKNPKEIVYKNTRFSLMRASIGPGATILVRDKYGKTIFSSACTGLDAICLNNKYLTGYNIYYTAKIIRATEVSAGNGIIDNMIIENPDEGEESYENTSSKSYTESYRLGIHNRNLIYMSIFAAPIIVFLLSSFIAVMWSRVFRPSHCEEN